MFPSHEQRMFHVHEFASLALLTQPRPSFQLPILLPTHIPTSSSIIIWQTDYGTEHKHFPLSAPADLTPRIATGLYPAPGRSPRRLTAS
jgi:hypothetical protein